MKFPDDVPTLTAGDVILRPHHLADAAGIVEQCNDPESIRCTTAPLGYDRAMAVDWVTATIPQGWREGREWIFALESTHPDGERRFSGSLSLRPEASNRAEIAYGAHPAIRGGGVMTTAVNLLLDYGFEQLGLETIIWWANRGNVPSRRVAWKSGFTFAGTLPGWLDQRGEARDAWVGSLHKTAPRVPSCEWFDIPVIESTRLRLRPLVDADSGRIVEACSDPVTRHWLSLLPHPYTSADAADFVLRTDEMAASGQGISWAIADVSTDELIGNVTLSVQQHNAMVGYWMHPAARGRGLMTEAVAAVARHAFVSKADGGLGIPRVWLKAAAGNVASQRVALACGFVECGRERQSEVTGDGSCHDALVFDLLAAEWSRN